MQGKKLILAQAFERTGLTRLLESVRGQPLLLILNYHRVGHAEETPYDSGTFSCTAAEFDWQVGHVKQRFPIVGLQRAVDIALGRAIPKETEVMLSFDDGYRDNYDEAFTVLKRHGATAVFFLPTAFVGSGVLPWWDVIAFLVKQAKRDRIMLHYPETAEFDLTQANRQRAVMKVLKQFKRPAVTDPERFVSELEAACDTVRPTAAAERCFLNWDEAREMQAAGMGFGSHTHTHPILSKLPYAAQAEELSTSRAILERELGRTVDALAYPVGQRDSFSADTRRALEETGYAAAFSFYSGVNRPGAMERYDVLRGAVEDEPRAVFRLRLGLRAATGRELI